MLVTVTGDTPELTNTRRNRAFLQLGRWSSHYEVPLLITTPELFGSLPRHLTGWKWANDNPRAPWVHSAVRFQDSVIYDAMYLDDLKRHRQRYKRLLHLLEVRHIPCFNPVLPAKDKVYQVLSKQDTGELRLPRTWYDMTPNMVIRRLKDTPCLWLKPTYGSGGRNMMFIKRLSTNRYIVMAERFYGTRVQSEMDKAQVTAMIAVARRHRRYMAQEHIALLQTADKRRVDLRVTVQRDVTGQWKVTALTGRTSANHSILTNYHAGGRITSLTVRDAKCAQWAAKVGMSEMDLNRAQRCALAAANGLQAVNANLGLLGVDVGQTEDGSQFVYDCNGRPGRDILTDAEVEVFMRYVAGFSRYLHRQVYPN
jgi:glutathione synthase/RimK-type ligase-like ATP-grasp enzyme